MFEKGLLLSLVLGIFKVDELLLKRETHVVGGQSVFVVLFELDILSFFENLTNDEPEAVAYDRRHMRESKQIHEPFGCLCCHLSSILSSV